MRAEPHKHLFYEFTETRPPTVFVDNNFGYAAYVPILTGYKNTSLKYSSIKPLAGMNVYCSSESIGICIFKNDTMFSCTDMSMRDFFSGVTLPKEVSISVFSVVRVTESIGLVTAIANVSPLDNRVLISSKTVVLDGARISISTALIPALMSEEDKGKFTTLYENDGSWTRESIEEKFITYEGYNDSTGFGDIGTEEILIGDDTSSARISFCDIVIRDAISIEPELSFFSGKDIYAFESFKHKDKMIYIGVSGGLMYTAVESSDGTLITSQKAIKNSISQDSFNNVLYSPIMPVPYYRNGNTSDYEKIFTPIGLLLDFKKYIGIIITRVEEPVEREEEEGEESTASTTVARVSEYLLTISGGEDEVTMTVKGKEDDDGNLIPTSSYNTDVDSDSSKYTNGITLKTINPDAYIESEVAARNIGLRHGKHKVGEVPGLERDVATVKSMSDIIMYL